MRADILSNGNAPRHPIPTALAFQSHLVTPGILRQFRKLQRACPPHFQPFFLMHVPPGTPKPEELKDIPHHFVTTPEIRTPEYPGKSAGGADWSIWAGGHTDLPGLHFYRKHPGFGRYWFMEYDVRWSGRWERFFAHFENSQADLLATTMRTAETQPNWWMWALFGAPEGPSKVLPNFRWEDRAGCLMPLFRASAKAMETMDSAYREGWTGHCEVTWPTLLRNAGLRLEDIGGLGEFVAPENRGRFYSNSLIDGTHCPGTFVFRPAKWPLPRLRRNMLWHPIKPLDVTLGMTGRERYWNFHRRLQAFRQSFRTARGPSQRDA